MDNLVHDMAVTVADAETVDLGDAKDDAFTAYMNICAKLDEAYNAAYDKAYARLEKQYGSE